MNIRAIIGGFAFGLIAGTGAVLIATSTTGCSGNTKPAEVAKAAVTLANDACVVVHAIAADNKTAQTVCVYESEISPLVPIIVAGRAKPVDAGK